MASIFADRCTYAFGPESKIVFWWLDNRSLSSVTTLTGATGLGVTLSVRAPHGAGDTVHARPDWVRVGRTR